MAEAPVPSPYGNFPPLPTFDTGLTTTELVTISISSVATFCLFSTIFCCYKSRKERFDSISRFSGPDPEDGFIEETQTRVTGNATNVDVNTVERVTQSRLTDVIRERNRAHPRPGKQTGLTNYINKVLRLLFLLSGVFTIFFSVILDNSFNDRPVRFTGFGILAPVMIFLGLLASGWFPRIPLRFIACVKRRGFLKHVMPCSPWHDNVVTDFTGGICTLEPLEDISVVYSQLPEFVQVFLYGTGQDFSHRTDINTPSTLDPEPRLQDLQEAASSLDSQLTLPNLQETLPPVGHTVVQIDHSYIFDVSDDERVPMLTIKGPAINHELPLKVEVFKNASTRDPTFDLSCIFRDKRTRRMYLTVERLHYLAQNMLHWMKNPYPIVVEASSDILHCMAIQDILWEFTRGLYTFKSVHVAHHYLGCLVQNSSLFKILFVGSTFALSLIPLLSDKKSYFFLFFLVVVVPYLFTLNFYNCRSFLCPIFIKIWGFRALYTSRSLFRWCNEFRKERVLNPTYFWIDEKYSNRFLSDGESLFDFNGFVELSDSRKNQSFVMTYEDDPAIEIQIRHAYKLSVIFDTVEPSDTCYTNVSLIFCEDDDVLGRLNCSALEMNRLDLIEKLFHCYSDPNFGGYVEAICPGFWKGTYLGHSPRFLDICNEIISDKSIRTLLVASRMPGSKFIIGVPFWSSTTANSE